MTFGHPHAFWLLLIVGTFAGIDQLRRRVSTRPWANILRLRAHATSIECPPRATARDHRWRLWTGLALLVVALASPRAGFDKRPAPRPAREVVVAMDLSRSMLARDVKPSRMDHAKLLAAGLVERSAGDRLALVLFSSTAYLALPLSDDYSTFSELLPDLSPDYFPKSGTNFGAMLASALTAYSPAADTDRFLLVLSDGEAFDDTWKAALDEFKKRGIHIITVGVGTKTGDVLVSEGVTIRNNEGAEVVSRLTSAALEEMALATGGAYAAGASWLDLQSLLKTPVQTSAVNGAFVTDETQLVERYRWLLIPALALLAWSFCVEFPVKPSLRQIRLPAYGGAAAAGMTKPESRMTNDEPPSPSSATSGRSPNSHLRSPAATAASAASSLALLLALTLSLPFVPSSTRAQDGDEAQRMQMEGDPRSPLRSLSGLVTQRIQGILDNPKPNANDCVSLVIDIIAYCENIHRARQRFPLSIIDDANKAIDWGERMDPQGGAWNKLRGDLKVLLKANLEPWKTAKADAAGKTDIDVGFDPNTEMKNDKNASGLRIADPTANAELEDVKATFADSPAFGDMTPGAKAAPESDEPPLESDQQVVGGKKNSALTDAERHPELVLPLQKLQMVRRADTPAKLFQMLDKKPNAPFVPPSPEW
jgi:Ca-activated chloride channel family protein